MSANQQHATDSRIARLASADVDANQWTFYGVAVGEGEIARDSDGDKKIWTQEELKEALNGGRERTLEGEPVAKGHVTDDDGNPIYPPPIDKTVGRVTKARYVPDKGVVYEMSISDEEIARKLATGDAQVSIHARHADGGEHEESGAMRAAFIHFRDLAVVSKGAAAQNTVNEGDLPADLAAMSAGDLEACLEAQSDGGGGSDDPTSQEGRGPADESSDNEPADSTFMDPEERIKELESRIDDLEDENEELEEQNEELENELDETEDELETEKDQREDVEEELDDAKNSIAEAIDPDDVTADELAQMRSLDELVETAGEADAIATLGADGDIQTQSDPDDEDDDVEEEVQYSEEELEMRQEAFSSLNSANGLAEENSEKLDQVRN